MYGIGIGATVVRTSCQAYRKEEKGNSKTTPNPTFSVQLHDAFARSPVSMLRSRMFAIGIFM